MLRNKKDKNTREKRFNQEKQVWVRNYRGEKRWTPGIVVKQKGPVSYEVKVAEGLVWRRHADQLRPRFGRIGEAEHKESDMS